MRVAETSFSVNTGEAGRPKADSPAALDGFAPTAETGLSLPATCDGNDRVEIESTVAERLGLGLPIEAPGPESVPAVLGFMMDLRRLLARFWNPIQELGRALQIAGRVVVSALRVAVWTEKQAAADTGKEDSDRTRPQPATELVKKTGFGVFSGVGTFYTMLLRVDLRGAAGAVAHVVHVLIDDLPRRLGTGAIDRFRNGVHKDD